MAGDALKPVQPGQRLRIPAGAYNAFVEAARAHRAAAHDRQAGEHLAPAESGVVLVKNTTETDLARFDVLGIDAVLVDPADNEPEFVAVTALSGVAPTPDHADRFVILLEPLAAGPDGDLANGSIGRAMLQGVTRARLYVEEDQVVGYAGPADGETGYLVPASHGAQVIWRAGGASTDPSDLKWALVRLPHAGPVAGEAEVTAVTTSDAWVTQVTAHPLAPDGSADTSVSLTLKATDVSNLAAGYMVGYPSGDGKIEVGDKVGYVACPGYSENFDGWLIPYAGHEGPVLAVTVDLPAPNILAGQGIWTETVEVAGVEHAKIHFDPVDPGGGLAWDPDPADDTSEVYVLTDPARGMGRDNDGIFPDLAPKGGLALTGDPADADRDLMVLADNAKALYVDQSNPSTGVQVIIAASTYSHGLDWLTGPGLKYATSDLDGVLGLALNVAQYGGLTISPLAVLVTTTADDHEGISINAEDGNLQAYVENQATTGEGISYDADGKVTLLDPYSSDWHELHVCPQIWCDDSGRIVGWYYWDGEADAWYSPWGYSAPS